MPLNSFFLFCKDNRKEVKKENSNLSNSEVTAILGEQWRNAGVSVKEKYQDLAKKNREVNSCYNTVLTFLTSPLF